jgi:hypothetical protein
MIKGILMAATAVVVLGSAVPQARAEWSAQLYGGECMALEARTGFGAVIIEGGLVLSYILPAGTDPRTVSIAVDGVVLHGADIALTVPPSGFGAGLQWRTGDALAGLTLMRRGSVITVMVNGSDAVRAPLQGFDTAIRGAMQCKATLAPETSGKRS